MKVLTLLLALGGAAAVPAAHAQSVAGNWDATLQTPGGPRTYRMSFEVKGDTLTGTVKRPSGDVALTGFVKGPLVKFSYTINYNGSDLLITVTATITGDAMEGTVDYGGAAEDSFAAKRVSGP